MAATACDFLLEDLELIISSTACPILAEKDQMVLLYEDLKVIRDFLRDTEERWDEHEELKLLVEYIRHVAYGALDRFDWFVTRYITVGHTLKGPILSDSYLGYFMRTIEFIRGKVRKVYEEKLYGTCVAQYELSGEASCSQARVSSPFVEEGEEIGEGFKTEAMKILDRLTSTAQKQLDVISIVGMPGIGKTTLAKRVYNDLLTEHRFDIRGWTYVSQEYQKRDLLLRILASVGMGREKKIHEMSDQELTENLYKSSKDTKIHEMTDQELIVMLYKSLKGKRYLIVLDDIWDIRAWEDLKGCFSNDNNGSRILLTTRITNVASCINGGKPLHQLPLLTQDESWDLLQQKAFHKEICPPKLMEIGKQITAMCKGLPLAIAVVGGLLATKEKTKQQWTQVAKNLSSYIIGEAVQFSDILEWSYNNLPHYLKQCFLYFREFPEDDEIPVAMLFFCWIAEGFVQEAGQKRLEDVAEEYLMDLIERNLVLVVKKKYGEIIECRIHDMLRDLCYRKGMGENFLWRHQNYSYPKGQPCEWELFGRGDQLCLHSYGFHYFPAKPCAPYLRLTYATQGWVSRPYVEIFIYKLLRILCLHYIDLDKFPKEVSFLVHLKFLLLRACNISKPEFSTLKRILENLWNLEILHIDCQYEISLPHNLCNMLKLRHLDVPSLLILSDEDSHCGYTSNSVLNNLQSISTLSVCDSTSSFLARTPNLRELDLRTLHRGETLHFPDVVNLIHLEKLKFFDSRSKPKLLSIPQWSKFPPNLKELTLSGSKLDWKGMSTLGLLPQLKFLKLKRNFFKGPVWRTTHGGFPKLRFLKLVDIDVEQWITSSDHFPCLHELVLERCKYLEQIPSALGDIPTLLRIEVYKSSRSASYSAKEIEEEQHDNGNYELKVIIRAPIEQSREEKKEVKKEEKKEEKKNL